MPAPTNIQRTDWSEDTVTWNTHSFNATAEYTTTVSSTGWKTWWLTNLVKGTTESQNYHLRKAYSSEKHPYLPVSYYLPITSPTTWVAFE